MRSSFSQNNTYKNCPQHWAHKYLDKIDSSIEGASLAFGSAIDFASESMLKGESNWLEKFEQRWTQSYSFGKYTQIFDNPNIIYSYKDFDADILDDSDFKILGTWLKQLKLVDNSISLNKEDILSAFKTIVKLKKNVYKSPTVDELTFFNRASWLSLKNKGKILLKAFNEQFYPKVTKVHAVQLRSDIKDPSTGDSLVGYIDMVLEIEGYDKPIIFDLKTASKPYTQDNIELSEQLALYSAMKGQEFNTDLVGYVVLCKEIQKKDLSKCEDCGNLKTSQHTTCNAVKSDGKRCGGKWLIEKELDPQVQVLVESKSDKQINDYLNDATNIMKAMKDGIIYRDLSKCTNWYGSSCIYYDLCHNGSMKGLTKR